MHRETLPPEYTTSLLNECRVKCVSELLGLPVLLPPPPPPPIEVLRGPTTVAGRVLMIAGELIDFVSPVSWCARLCGPRRVGRARTDRNGSICSFETNEEGGGQRMEDICRGTPAVPCVFVDQTFCEQDEEHDEERFLEVKVRANGEERVVRFPSTMETIHFLNGRRRRVDILPCGPGREIVDAGGGEHQVGNDGQSFSRILWISADGRSVVLLEQNGNSSRRGGGVGEGSHDISMCVENLIVDKML